MKLAGGINFELEDCAIAVFDDAETMKTATDELDAVGLEYVVLEGESGQESLQPKQEGLVGNLQKLAAAFGDELRVIDRLEQSLAEGARVLIVRAEERQPEVVEMLNDHGGRFLWQFRGWTFNSAGSADHNSPPVAEEDGS
ncbi:MAG TPA: hypothetical protein VJQ79_06915 [Acidimicrobiia bacterium]|nr:hypothetical protein [Acidimicrobiia bacterium]